MRTIVRLCLLVIFIGASVSSQAQSKKDFKNKFAKASGYLVTENCRMALPYLIDLEKMDPLNANVAYMIGYCYLKSAREKQKAIPYLEKACRNISTEYVEESHKERNAPPEALKYLGEAYHFNYQFENAQAVYEDYVNYVDDTELAGKADVKRKMAICENAITLTSKPVPMKVENLGSGVNSPYADYAPVLSVDEEIIYFTSRRANSTGRNMDTDGKYFEDIFCARDNNGTWENITGIGTPINSAGHEATMSITADGQFLIIYKDEDIYQTMLVGDRWKVPEKMGSNINTEYHESRASVNATGDIIFFVSDRPGGLGGKDLYMAKKLPTGDWALATSLGGDINTNFDEESPYMHPDGKTLYFSSQGHGTMGGFDVFTSVMDEEGNWSKPVNIGYPVNTTGDDVFFVPTADGKRAYLSSFRKSGFGDQDIYLITLPEAEEKKIVVVKGILQGEDGVIPDDMDIVVSDNETGDIVGIYRPNSKSGKYLFILEPGKDYNVTYESLDYLFHSENLNIAEDASFAEMNMEVNLKPVKVGSKIVLNNLFFEFDKATILPTSEIELKKIVETLNNNPDIKVEISGYTDSKGDKGYNKILSANRAKTVVDMLVARGIDSKRLIYKGYGEANPIASNTNPDGSDNPEGRAKNRRTELKIVEMK